MTDANKGIVGVGKLPAPRQYDVIHTLDGERLKTGDRVALRFPNGQRVVRTVIEKAEDCYWGVRPRPGKNGELESVPEDKGHQFFVYRAYVEGPRGLVCLFRFTHDSQEKDNVYGSPGRIERVTTGPNP